MFKIRMDSSDSEEHPGEDDSFKYRYVDDGVVLREITKYTGERSIARFTHVLFNFGGSFIPAGQYSFPFSFKTGENYPASYMVPSYPLRTKTSKAIGAGGSSTNSKPLFEASTRTSSWSAASKK